MYVWQTDTKKSQLSTLTREAIRQCVKNSGGFQLLSGGIGMVFGNKPLCMSCDFYFFQDYKTCPSQISSDISTLVKFVEDFFIKLLNSNDNKLSPQAIQNILPEKIMNSQ